MNKYMEELTELLQTGLEEYATSEKYRDLLRVMSQLQCQQLLTDCSAMPPCILCRRIYKLA